MTAKEAALLKTGGGAPHLIWVGATRTCAGALGSWAAAIPHPTTNETTNEMRQLGILLKKHLRILIEDMSNDNRIAVDVATAGLRLLADGSKAATGRASTDHLGEFADLSRSRWSVVKEEVPR